MSMSTEFFEQLSTLQLADSFFPTGMYTTSNGLEVFYYQKLIKKPEEVRNLIHILLTQQIGPADCVALGNAYDCAKKNDLEKIIEVDYYIFTTKLIKEIREASSRSGTQLIRCLSYFNAENSMLNKYLQHINNGAAVGSYPVALAIACNSMGITKENAALILLYGFTVSLVGAALRLGLLQHFESQKIIHELKPIISNVVKKYVTRPLKEMWQFSPHMDLIQITHERMDAKMFIT